MQLGCRIMHQDKKEPRRLGFHLPSSCHINDHLSSFIFHWMWISSKHPRRGLIPLALWNKTYFKWVCNKHHFLFYHTNVSSSCLFFSMQKWFHSPMWVSTCNYLSRSSAPVIPPDCPRSRHPGRSSSRTCTQNHFSLVHPHKCIFFPCVETENSLKEIPLKADFP